MREEDVVAHQLQHLGVELEELGFIVYEKNGAHGSCPLLEKVS